MDTRNIGNMHKDDLDANVIGKPLSVAKEFDWGMVGKRWGYEWAPVVNAKGVIVDIIDIDSDNQPGEYPSFYKKLPVRWDGRVGAYRTAKKAA